MGIVWNNAQIPSTATAYGNQRKIDRCQNGVLWSVIPYEDTTARNLSLWYSTDNSATWGGGFTPVGGGKNFTSSSTLYIDPDDFAHIAYKDTANGFIYYIRGTPNAARTSYTWSTPLNIDPSNSLATGMDYPDMWVGREGTGWVAHIVASLSNAGVKYCRIPISSDGTISPATALTSLAASEGARSAHTYPSIDGNHTGDGKTVAGGAPHLYVGWSSGATGSGNGIRFRKATYASGSWTWGTEREIDSARYVFQVNNNWLNCLFDGTRVIFGGELYDGTNADQVLHERDAADTTTTPRVLVDNDTDATRLYGGSMTYDSGNAYLFGRRLNGSTFTRCYRKYDRASGVQTLVDLGPLTNPSCYLSVRRGGGQALDYVYTDGASSPYTVSSGRAVLNNPPTAATPTTPAAGSSVDRTQPITLAWVFNDPDAGDSQSKSDIRYKLSTASSWTTILGATTTTTSYALPANQAAGNYEWQVLTYDALGVASPWSASSFFTAGDPPGVPVITSPPVGGTVSNTHTVTWSSPQQDAYEVRRVADSAGAPNTGTVYSTTGTVEDATARTRTLVFETNNRTEHVQVRVRYSGIWSQWASARVLVSYTPPATPLVVLTPQDATGSMLVTITNPTPSGSQPTVASHDILIDDGFGEGFTRRATGWAPGAPYTYWLPVSGRDYTGNIQVVAMATNSTTSTGVAT